MNGIDCATVMDWLVTLFQSSYSGLPSGESNNQVVNLNNLTLTRVEGTPVGSVHAICSLLLLERDVQRIRVMLFLNRVAICIRNTPTSFMQNSALWHLHQFRVCAGARRQSQKRLCAAETQGGPSPKVPGPPSQEAPWSLHSENIYSYHSVRTTEFMGFPRIQYIGSCRVEGKGRG